MNVMLAYALNTIVVTSIVLAVLVQLLASVHDTVSSRRLNSISQAMRRLRKGKQPWVTILLYADERPDAVLQSLHSLSKSSYSQFDVVIVDNIGSKPYSSQLKNLMSSNKIPNVYLYVRRKVTRPSEAFQQAYRRSKRGEVIMTLGAGICIDKNTLKRSVAELKQYDSAKVIQLATQANRPISLSGVLASICLASKQVWLKALSLLGTVSKERLDSNLVLTKTDFLAYKKQTKLAWRYSSTFVTANADYVPSTTIRHRLIIVFVFGLLALLVAAAVTRQNTTLFSFAWLTTCLWVGAAVSFDQSARTTAKIPTFVSLPFIPVVIIAGMSLRLFVPLSIFIRISRQALSR